MSPLNSKITLKKCLSNDYKVALHFISINSDMNTPMPTEKPEQANRPTDDDTAVVNVGDPPVAISISKGTMCSVAPYFNNYFNGPFKEGGTKFISLPDVTERCFNVFLDWAQVHVETIHHFKLASSSALGETDLMELDEAISNAEWLSNQSTRICPAGYCNATTDYDSHCCAQYGKKSLDTDEEGQAHIKDAAEIDSVLGPLLELYIFADKYSVHQLRDDILTALSFNMIDFEAAPTVSVQVIK
jgi:hypothetical protein